MIAGAHKASGPRVVSAAVGGGGGGGLCVRVCGEEVCVIVACVSLAAVVMLHWYPNANVSSARLILCSAHPRLFED